MGTCGAIVGVLERLGDGGKICGSGGGCKREKEREWEEGGKGAINTPCLNHYYYYLVLPSYIAKASLRTIFPCILQGAFFAWKATAMGKNYINGKTFLEKR